MVYNLVEKVVDIKILHKFISMRIKKIEKRLSKINRVFNAFKDDGNISKIEKDLLLGYVRDLYDLIIDNDDEPVDVNEEKLEKQPIVQIFEKEDVEVVDQISTEIIEIEEEVKEELIEEEILDNNPTEVLEGQKSDALNIYLSDKLVEIFNMPGVTDLSDKLASSPISDVSKSMGINERYFTISELFGGDSQKFVEACDALNNFKSLDQAQPFLVDIAVKYGWEKGPKMKKAHNFVKHINRRYL